MATFVQAWGRQGTGTTVTIDLDTTYGSGTPSTGNNLICIFWAWNNGSTMSLALTDDESNTWTEDLDYDWPSDNYNVGWWHLNDLSSYTSPLTLTVTPTGGTGSLWWNVHVLEYSGGDLTAESTPTPPGGDTSSPYPGGSVTGDDLTIASYSHEGSASAISLDSGTGTWTQRTENEGYSSGQPWNTADSTSTGTINAQWSTTGGNPKSYTAVVVYSEASSGTAHTSSETEAAGVTDSTSRDHTAERTESEAAGVTDSTSLLFTYERAPTEAVGVTDSVSTVSEYKPSTSEAVGVTDSATESRGVGRTPTEAAGVTDTISVQQIHGRTSTEAVGAIDDTSRDTTMARATIDSVGVSDATSTSEEVQYVETVPEAVGATDSVTFSHSPARSATDAAGVTDSVTRDLVTIRATTEAVGVIDDTTPVEGLVTYPETTTETVGVTDGVWPTLPLVLELQDITDPRSDLHHTLWWRVSGDGDPDETVTVGLYQGSTLIQGASYPAPGATITDNSLTISAPNAGSITDYDNLQIHISARRDDGSPPSLQVYDLWLELPQPPSIEEEERTEAVGATDSLSTLGVRDRTVTEAAGVTDSVSTVETGSLDQQIDDTVGVTDDTSRDTTADRTATEAAGVIDALTIRLAGNLIAEITEAVGVVDDTNVTTELVTVTVPEPLIPESIPYLIGADGLWVTDPVSIIHVAPFHPTYLEAVGITDLMGWALTTARTYTEAVTEDIGASDGTTKKSPLRVTPPLYARVQTASTRTAVSTISTERGAGIYA